MKSTNKFKLGQKVWCYYHFTLFFKPPMCGKILFRFPFRKKHHFSPDGLHGKCYWYFVLMQNWLIVLMPEVCMNDLRNEIERHDYRKPPLDEKQIDSWLKLQQWQFERKQYIEQ